VNPYEPLTAYIAAPFEERETALELKANLEAMGVKITSTWLTPADGNDKNMARLQNRFHDCRCRAVKDLRDIDAGDYFILIKPKKMHRVPTTGGHHVETGYAIAKGKPVIVYGDRENVFHYLPGVQEARGFLALLHLLSVEKSYGCETRTASGTTPSPEQGPVGS
jgi:nucleoside 2-deoxyribosyltransferase